MSKIDKRQSDLLATSSEVLDLRHDGADPKRPDVIRRFELASPKAGPIRISADLRTEGVTGPPGGCCMVFFNIEYTEGPVFWDMFLYPDTGTTPWRILSCEARDRGPVRAVEMHIRFQSSGRLLLRNLRIETVAPWGGDAEAVVVLFGDSTDMTNYLPTEFRLGRRLELLLRDRFPESRIDVHCLAEGGETLQRLLESGRLDRELRCLPRCDLAMIRYGLNDASRGIDPAAFARQLQTASDMIHGRFPKAQVVLSTTIPSSAAAYDRQTVAMAATLGVPLIRLDEFIRKRSAAGDSDWHHQAGSRVGRRRDANPAANPDGLGGDKHPNAYGAQMIAEHYFEHLEPMVAARVGATTEGQP
jgi:lysophospholipase L1-like esterase